VTEEEDFKHKLAGTVDWKALAMHQMHLISQAEIREKNFCWESRYFYETDEAMIKELELNDGQREYMYEQYMTWLEEKGKI